MSVKKLSLKKIKMIRGGLLPTGNCTSSNGAQGGYANTACKFY